MKKGLIGLIAGIGLFFGSGNLKAQVTDCFFKNKDKDLFSEEIFGVSYKVYSNNSSGSTYIGYFDEDNDNFYEHIKIINGENESKIVVENFYISPIKGPAFYGFLNYDFKIFNVDEKTYDKYFFKMNPQKFLKMNKLRIRPSESVSYSDLNWSDLETLHLLKRFGSLSKTSYSRERFVKLLEKERALGRASLEK